MAAAPFPLGGGPVTARPSVQQIELTDRQVEVLTGYAQGHDTPVIAHQMQISVQSVRDHLKAAMVRLGAPNGTNAICRAIGLGLLPATVALTTPQGASHVR